MADTFSICEAFMLKADETTAQFASQPESPADHALSLDNLCVVGLQFATICVL